MDPRYSGQDILRCDLCETALVQSHCELCHIKLCKACVGEHLSDSSKNHRVVPYRAQSSIPNYPKCPNHAPKLCELYCEKCDIPVCTTCISSGKHHGHNIIDVIQKLSSKTVKLEKDLKDLEENIYPKYEEIHSELKSEKANIVNRYKKLTKRVIDHGEEWHREIDIIVNKLKSEIDDMKTKHLASLIQQEKEITQNISEVQQSILDMKKILEKNDISLISSYKSRNVEFRRFPPKLKASLPSFSPQLINKEKVCQQFGSLTELSMTTEEYDYAMETPEAVSSPPVKTFLDEPKFITSIDTGYTGYIIRSVTCLTDEEVWTGGGNKIIKLYNLQGNLLMSIKTKSGYQSFDIAVTRSGDLVFTDYEKSTVNIVKNKQIQEMIRLHGWKPHNVCSTSSGDLLVTMDSDDGKQSKVVRYSGNEEIQSIQFDDKGKPLYSSYELKHISENRNLDICVADYSAKAVVVVNHAGKLQFRYTGHPSIASASLNPYGITTDSESQILTSDSDNHCIHILDQNGQFLHYIGSCALSHPWGLCVDSRNNLFVAECHSGKVKKIKYMKLN